MTDTEARLALVVVSGQTDYHVRLLHGIRSVLERAGVACLVLVLGSRQDPRLPTVLPDMIRTIRPDGAVMTRLEMADKELVLLDLLRSLAIPTSTVGIDVPDLPGVQVDNVAGMRDLMRHLLDERRVRRPALVRGIPFQEDSVEREAVFRQELAARGLAVAEELVVDGGFCQAVTYPALRAVLDRERDLDAVVALNDLSAVGAVSALTAAGLRVPEDVLVTGFDNDRIAASTWPGMTTVDQQLELQGSAAAEQLLLAMAEQPGESEVVVPTRLVVRGSTGRVGTVHDELAVAVATATEAQARLDVMDAALGLNSAMLSCRTLPEVLDAVTRSLRSLGFRRLFLTLHDAPGAGGAPDDGPDGGPDDAGRGEQAGTARLVLAHRDGELLDLPAEPFPVQHLLPGPLRGELRRGSLTVHALRVGARDLGCLLTEYDEQRPDSFGASITMDLGRTLDAVLNHEELDRRANDLEREVAARTGELRRLNAELQRSLMTDGLTRIANRAAFDQYLHSCWNPARPDDLRHLALLMVDVDLFKAFNDRYGHVRGDETLRVVADCLDRAVRHADDLACRYGGEEFAVLLPGADLDDALAVAGRFRQLLAEAAVPHAASSVTGVVTASVGLTLGTPGRATPPQALIEAADAALYRAKEQGRDQVVVVVPGRDDSNPAPEDPAPEDRDGTSRPDLPRQRTGGRRIRQEQSRPSPGRAGERPSRREDTARPTA
ncbi:MAG: GGDEF domain-containing protein [Actinomycetales bacterium]|nr:GGDEF domain-containing protein [Actinomycetales bacterium]